MQEMNQLDEALADTTATDLEIKINIPMKSTRREAMRIVHWEAAEVQKTIMVEALLHKKQVWTARISKNTLLENCKAGVDKMLNVDAVAAHGLKNKIAKDKCSDGHRQGGERVCKNNC